MQYDADAVVSEDQGRLGPGQSAPDDVDLALHRARCYTRPAALASATARSSVAGAATLLRFSSFRSRAGCSRRGFAPRGDSGLVDGSWARRRPDCGACAPNASVSFAETPPGCMAVPRHAESEPTGEPTV